MRKLQDPAAGGRAIKRFESVGAVVRGVSQSAHVVLIRVGVGGLVGRHRAGTKQLFVVIAGSGWASGGDGERVALSAGEAVVWEAGEEHESGSVGGMTALVVEAERLEV